MEQQKILTVIIAVLSVLAIIVCAGLFMFNPDSSDEMVIASIRNDIEPEVDASPETVLTPEVQVSSPETIVEDDGFTEQTAASHDLEYVIHSPEPESGPVLVVTEEAVAQETVSDSEPILSTVPSVPVRIPQMNPSQPAPSQPSETEREPEPELPSIQYWIQVGSFSGRVKAESIAEDFGNQGLAAVVSSIEGEDSSVFFRVRIGPYINQDEANRFLTIVKTIEGFSSSYISEVYP